MVVVVVDVVDVVDLVDVVDVVVLIVMEGSNTEKMEFILPCKPVHLRNEWVNSNVQNVQIFPNSWKTFPNLFLAWKLSELMRCHICIDKRDSRFRKYWKRIWAR